MREGAAGSTLECFQGQQWGVFFQSQGSVLCSGFSQDHEKPTRARKGEKIKKEGPIGKICPRQIFSRGSNCTLAGLRSPALPLECHRARKQCHAHAVAGRVFQGKFQDFGVSAVVKNASSTRQKTCETGIQREAALSESLPRALSALCASIRVLCEVLLGQKDKKRQFALVKSGMAVFNITIGLPQILLMPISL